MHASNCCERARQPSQPRDIYIAGATPPPPPNNRKENGQLDYAKRGCGYFLPLFKMYEIRRSIVYEARCVHYEELPYVCVV